MAPTLSQAALRAEVHLDQAMPAADKIPETTVQEILTDEGSQGYAPLLEAERIFREVLMRNESLQLPPPVAELAENTTFGPESFTHAVIPCPLKLSETSAALWATAATVGNLICKKRYGKNQTAVINMEIATLYLFSAALVSVGGKNVGDPEISKRYAKYDQGNTREPYRRLTTNVYPTKDRKWFHLHGSMNSTPTLTMLGLPTSRPELSEQAAIDTFIETVRAWNSADIDNAADSDFRQAGTICLTPAEFKESAQGRAIAQDGLYRLQKMAESDAPPMPWPQPQQPSTTNRPLEGIKILDLSRVIAAPTVAKLAALFGATVVRISCATNPDMGPLLVEGNLGKRDVTLDLKSNAGKAMLRTLIADCDVFLDGYRPGALERLGFGPAAVRAIAEEQGHGIVYIRENCYGWHGPLAHRSGWQQISDCVTGVSWLQGQFLGLDEPVVPLLPNSDYQTGVIGLIGMMAGLLRREAEGGSYILSVALNYYNLFLLSCGEYSVEVQDDLKKTYASTPIAQLRHYDDMPRLVGKSIMSLKSKNAQIFRKEHFDSMPARLGVEGEMMTFVGSPAKFSETKLGYDIGSCFLNEDEPRWP